jgi:hypothetical protein
MKKLFLVIMVMLMGIMFVGCNEPTEAVLEDEGTETIIVEEIIVEDVIVE